MCVGGGGGSLWIGMLVALGSGGGLLSQMPYRMMLEHLEKLAQLQEIKHKLKNQEKSSKLALSEMCLHASTFC